MITQRPRRTRREQRGAVAVEFALLVIPLLMIIAGIVNFGFAFAQQLALDNAVRQAARAGVVDTGAVSPAANMTAVAKTEFASSALGAATAPTITFPASNTCKGSEFGSSMKVNGTVALQYPFPWFVPSSVISNQVNLKSSAEFQCEYS